MSMPVSVQATSGAPNMIPGAPVALGIHTDAAPARHFLGVHDLSAEQIRAVLDTALAMKAQPAQTRGSEPGPEPGPVPGAGALSGSTAVLLFEKPSLRTRISFEAGIVRLGGHPMYYDHGSTRIGERESIKDYAKNLERFVSMIIARVHDHATLEGLAEHASIPVINALSDLEHPCQALADILTIRETFGTLGGVRLAWVGDGNNVCHSLMLAAASLGMDMTVVTPRGFEPRFEVIRQVGVLSARSGASVTIGHDPEAVVGHHAVYTDSWVSMGQDAQASFRQERFAGLQVDTELMALASSGLERPSIFMHCLPAHRGEEVTDEVIDSAHSVVYRQAENRMHAQNALLLHLLGIAPGA